MFEMQKKPTGLNITNDTFYAIYLFPSLIGFCFSMMKTQKTAEIIRINDYFYVILPNRKSALVFPQ